VVADRHGRAARADNDPRRRPADGYRIRTPKRFRRVVEEAVASLPDRFAEPLSNARLHVVDVPPDPIVTIDGDIVLATFGDDLLTVYRRPVEARADSRGALEDILAIAIAQAVGRSQGWGDDIDELFS